jgi:hypothetical protein
MPVSSRANVTDPPGSEPSWNNWSLEHEPADQADRQRLFTLAPPAALG